MFSKAMKVYSTTLNFNLFSNGKNHGLGLDYKQSFYYCKYLLSVVFKLNTLSSSIFRFRE